MQKNIEANVENENIQKSWVVLKWKDSNLEYEYLKYQIG